MINMSEKFEFLCGYKGDLPVFKHDWDNDREVLTFERSYGSLKFVGTEKQFSKFYDDATKDESECKIISIYKTQL